ncbi:MFS general substrate transporter [Aspergillus uvarum CBS 121591]|uniref:MFS general substrate transporter n=1 Tax=Aspergillus uvarum CBS 121591 TaxID=1448315 RepID=A0A319CEB2_9EURO|nr:MFS general substrate transporter [Aspergillus uvarum CBS 121591]PYH83554.1 MFS general substrate transporter [Aspergillus uvarum CBS 121591]
MTDTKEEKLAAVDYGLGDLHDDQALLRRIDWRILPTMFLTYLLQFLDKVALNYANVMGMQDDLGMQGNDFSWLATGFFIAYAVAEIPQGFMLQRYPVTRVLGVNILCWGVLLCCSAAAQNFAGMLSLRVILGALEAVIAPALTMYTSMWYTRAESTPRYGLWYCGLGTGQIVGGLISFAAQHTAPTLAFHGWRIMFVAIGGVNILAALLVLLGLPVTPAAAGFLSASDKARVAQRLQSEQAGGVERENGLRPRSFLDAFADLQTALLVLLTILITIPSGVITTFSSILIKEFGYNSKKSALLNMPSGVVSIVATMGSTLAIARGYSRWLAINLLLLPTLLGACLMSFLPASNQAGCLAGIYLVNTTVAPLALIFAWTGANYKGYSMKVAGSTLVSAGFSIANIIGPQTFQARDAPEYIPAKITIVAVNAGAIVISTTLRVVYGRRNARANRLGQAAGSRIERQLEGAGRGGEGVDFPNGFIAAHCIAALLRAGHSVRGTVRTLEKASATVAALHAAGVASLDRLEIVVVADPTDLGQFAPAVAGCDAILHLASAFTYNAQPGQFEQQLLLPAIQGTTVACEAAQRCPTVRKLVIMSSFAAVYDAAQGLQPGRVYTEEDWSPLRYEEGRDTNNVALAYRASKVLAERAAWTYVKEHEVDFQLVTLCPGMVFGKMIHPIASLEQLNASNGIVWEVAQGGRDALPPTKAPVWVDVQDLAETCLHALTTNLSSHQRFLVTEGAYDTQEIADLLREAIPTARERVPEGSPGDRIQETHYACDSGKVRQMLGVQFRSLRESIIPLVEQLYALEAVQGPKT